MLKSINPYTNELINQYKPLEEVELISKINEANAAFLEWRDVSISERARLMSNCSRVLLENVERYANVITSEMGKIPSESEAEIEKCAWVCRYYAQNASRFLQSENITTDASESYVRYDPLGTILAVMPWNFPFWQVFRFAAPTLMAGNTGLLKHASNVTGCALEIESVFREAGFPSGVFTTLAISSDMVEEVIKHPTVQGVSLTGSEKAGAAVASNAGREIKRSLLELGGSDPFIVLKDADINDAVEVAVSSRMLNCGQSCIAAKRFIIVEDVYEKFIQKFVRKIETLNFYDPESGKGKIAPMAREDLRTEVLDIIEDAVNKGAKVLTDDRVPDKVGVWMTPTVISEVTHEMRAYREEIFGPVAIVYKVQNESEAVQLANDSEFGLGASIFTKDLVKARELARRINTGAVFVNGMVKSDPRLPFGGVKRSGYGRELGRAGIMEFVNQKTVWIN